VSTFPENAPGYAQPKEGAVMEKSAPRDEGGRGMIEIRSLSKTYASQDGPILALSDLSFSIADAEFVTIVGHSGCGKSTLLKIIAGLLPA